VTTRRLTVSFATLLAVGACGSSGATPEVVVADAAMGAGTPSLLGATADRVYWTVASGTGPRLVAGSPLAALPADGQQLGSASGPIVEVGDHVLLATDGTIVRIGVALPAAKIASAKAEALGESLDSEPLVVWTEGAVVSWGDGTSSATLPKIVRCDQVRVTATNIYVDADGTTDRRLLRIDRGTGFVSPLAASSTFASSFPGGAQDGATYRGRLVGADDAGALWLVEELPAGASATARAILALVPEQGAPTVLLAHVGAVTGFFVDAEAFYWQEADALLTAPRAGGAASIAGHVPGTAGAIADGFVYVTDGIAIERLALDTLE
jgi:hypothetical protein